MDLAYMHKPLETLTISTVSTAFTILCASIPSFVFASLLIGANIKGIDATGFAFLFMACVFLGVLFTFFAACNLVEAVAAAAGLLIPLTVIGNSAMKRFRSSGVLIF